MQVPTSQQQIQKAQSYEKVSNERGEMAKPLPRVAMVKMYIDD